MYDKIKNFFARYWLLLIVLIGLSVLGFYCFKSCTRCLETTLKNNKVSVNIYRLKNPK